MSVEVVAVTDDLSQDCPVVCIPCTRGYDIDGMQRLSQADCDEYGLVCATCKVNLYL